jgi:hypothetical protein
MKQPTLRVLHFDRLCPKQIVKDKHSSLFCLSDIDEGKKFKKIAPEAKVIKLFTAVSYEFL